MVIKETALNGCIVIETQSFKDDRGEFFRVFCADTLKDYIHEPLVQINHSINYVKGTLRGLHYQLPPYAEGKLIRCVSGAIYDVAVDLRQGSDTFLEYTAVELSAENKKLIYIPPGFAHGFITLEDDSQLIYHHTKLYTPGYEAGFNYQDPAINISWPLPAVITSDRDKNLPFISKEYKGIEI